MSECLWSIVLPLQYTKLWECFSRGFVSLAEQVAFELHWICFEMLGPRLQQGKSFKLQVNKADSNTPRHGHGPGHGQS